MKTHKYMTFIIHVIVVVVADDDDDGGSETVTTTSSRTRGNVRNDLSEWQQRHATLVLSKIKVRFFYSPFSFIYLLWVSSTMVIVLCAKEFYIICIFSYA